MAKERNRNRIQDRAEFNKLIDELTRNGELRKLHPIAIRNDYSEVYEEAEAVLDWLLQGGLDFKKMSVKMVCIFRTYFMMAKGDLTEGKTSADYIDTQDSRLN